MIVYVDIMKWIMLQGDERQEEYGKLEIGNGYIIGNLLNIFVNGNYSK